MSAPDHGVSLDLPRGNITFLVTGIEGSTVRWDIHGEDMAQAVSVHDKIIREAISDAQGRVVRQVGDGLVAVFRSADGALRSAIGAQRVTTERNWSPVPALRVRIGIHSGWAEPIGDTYAGSVVNRASRVAESGHGGQVILSSSAAAGMAAPLGYEFVSRGMQRLKDLAEPIELFQVIGPPLESELIPLRTIDETVHTVPVQRTPLFGREHELRAAEALLDEHRLVTLCGSGGVGKTRLAMQIAAERAAVFSGGVRFADFSSTRPGDDLAAVMRDQFSTARIADHTGGDAFDSLARLVDVADVLLVVDNCEHVIDGAAVLIERLLHTCPNVKLLVTSRERLRLPNEQVMYVDPLVEHRGAAILDDPAVRLFIDGCAASGRTALTFAQIPMVVRICALVDRLPLGIELAAARAAYLPLEDLLSRLEEHYRVLVGRERSTSDRHRTIDGLLHWSRNTLPGPDRALFDRLGVFTASVDLAAIESVCSDFELGRDEILEVIASLVDRSLLRHNAASGRYDMLHLIRSFARSQLFAQDQLRVWEARHTGWCLAVVREMAGLSSREAAEKIRMRYGVEINAALDRAIVDGEASIAWELAGGVWRSFEVSGRAREGIDLLRRAAGLGPRDNSVAWAAMIQGLASLLLTVGEVNEAIILLAEAVGGDEKAPITVTRTRARNVLAMALLLAGREGAWDAAQQALSEFKQLNDRPGVGYALSSLGMIAAKTGNGAAAEGHYLNALVAFRSTGERSDAAAVLSNLGNLAHELRDLRRATRYFDGARQLYREVDDRRGMALVLNNLSLIALERRDFERARTLGVEAEALFTHLGDRPGAGAAQLNLANVAAEAGFRVDALSRYSQAIATFRAAREVRGVLIGLENLGDVAWSWGARPLGWRCEVEKATIQLRLGLVRGLRSSLHTLADRAESIGFSDLADRITRVSKSLIPGEVEEILAEAGLAGPVDDDDTAVSGVRPDVAMVGQLTNREREIILMVSEGRTNPEIAASLFISQRTVDSHLSHIRTKFGVTDRVKLAVMARSYLKLGI